MCHRKCFCEVFTTFLAFSIALNWILTVMLDRNVWDYTVFSFFFGSLLFEDRGSPTRLQYLCLSLFPFFFLFLSSFL